MFTDMQKNESEMNMRLQKKLFWVMVVTGCSANMAGFLSNALFFGMSLPTIGCGFCEIVMIICGVAGIRYGKQKSASAAMVLVLSLIEFPFLFYVYGANMGVYLILGVIGLAVYFPRPYHVAAIIVNILLDAAVIILWYIYPSTLEIMDKKNQLQTMLCSYLIVAVAAAVILCNLIGQYVEQHRNILKISRELEYAAHRDALTGVYNRGYLIDTLKQWMNQENKHFLAVLIDIDNFKKVNDTYGHVYGDEVLIELARLMKQEISGKGIAARYGGEEFMLLFETADRQQAMESLQKIKTGLGEFSMKTRQIVITFSGGMEEYQTEGRIDELFRNTDKKLYQAKHAGKNQVVF